MNMRHPTNETSTKRRAEDQSPQNTAKKSKTQHTTCNPQATFLGIPTELRVKICRYVLVDDFDDIYVYAPTHIKEPGLPRAARKMPALLRTCRQIRKEASDIYFEENDFNVLIDDYVFAPHRGHWLWTRVPAPRLLFAGQDDWERFISDWVFPLWKEVAHGREDTVMQINWWELVHDACISAPPEWHKVRRAVRVMADEGVSWETTKKVIAAYHGEDQAIEWQYRMK